MCVCGNGSISCCLLAAQISEIDKSTSVDFVRDVRPIFEKYCYECHSGKKEESGLRLDVKAAALQGGDNHGPDIVPREPKRSHLIDLIRSEDSSEVMPPDGKMPEAAIQTIELWIAQGAVWPDGVDQAKLADKADHWSFKPLNVPETNSSIDRFIDQKLRQSGLQRTKPAQHLQWFRRVTLDLTGLPPTPEQVSEFLAQSPPDYEAAVDRLLVSPRYGERWAQHWLDVVRYADTHGFEVNTERPNAWHYRDL